MFENVQPLSADTHRDLRYHRLPDYTFAAGLTSAPITFTEMMGAAKHVPVVFPREGTPIAILGADGKNRFVDENGQWTGAYIPTHVARYPFILGHTRREGEMVLMVDVDAPHFHTDRGERLFEADGTPTQVVDRTKALLGVYQAEAETSKRLTARLFEAEILAERALRRREGEETKTVLARFYVVERNKLDALPDDTIVAWHRDGTLALVHAHLLSLSNLPQLAA